MSSDSCFNQVQTYILFPKIWLSSTMSLPTTLDGTEGPWYASVEVAAQVDIRSEEDVWVAGLQ